MVPPGDVCAVVLAAGRGERLRPLTARRPKALCPVGNVPLLDRALRAVGSLGLAGPQRVAVNAWHLAGRIVAHVGDRAHVSVETGAAPLGSAGGLGALRGWVAGRHVLVANADAYLSGGDLSGLLDGWDGRGVRMLGVPAGDHRPEFGAHRFAGVSLIAADLAAGLPPQTADLVRAVWRPAEAAGLLRVVDYAGVYLDSGTPADYLAANLHAASVESGGCLVAPSASVGSGARVVGSVIGPGAKILGDVERCVVWPGARVEAGERLCAAIRYGRAGTVRTAPATPH